MNARFTDSVVVPLAVVDAEVVGVVLLLPGVEVLLVPVVAVTVLLLGVLALVVTVFCRFVPVDLLFGLLKKRAYAATAPSASTSNSTRLTIKPVRERRGARA